MEVTDTVSIKGNLPDVFRYFWRAELWPRITPHVKRIEMLEDGPTYQRFLMQVESEGRVHSVESERFAVPGESIRYQQTMPPALFRTHGGEWRFVAKDEGTEVSLTHRVEINADAAFEILKVTTMDEAERRVGAALRRNGMTTILAVKELVENGAAGQLHDRQGVAGGA
jgi:hypothetical protein